MDTQTFEDIRAAVDAALEAHLDNTLPRVASLHPALAPVVAELRGFVLGGGKRLRPTLLLLGYRAAGGTELEPVMGPALALELLHTCALVHDDLIDAAPTRRGRQSVHRRFAALHREEGWDGDPDAFGAAAAVLLGDLAFVQADELFLSADLDAERLLGAFHHFTLLREEVMAGQYVDVHASQSGATSRELAVTVASLKSGRYSVARPLEIGALLGGGDERLVTGLGRVGEPLGRAFQVRDDVLGVFGEEHETGKSVASDLCEGKRTLLVAETVARLDPEDRARFLSLLGDPGLDQAAAGWLREAMVSSGGLDATEHYIAERVEEALAAVAELDLEPEVTAALEAMAVFIRDRTS
ncbi:MAG: polyprenyl synthetase family protein [Nitriliruptorales bacterium]|nr:polyprenyl synthetase family protein [Nitriliruptorales bacterium]